MKSKALAFNLKQKHIDDLSDPEIGAAVVQLDSFPYHFEMLAEVMAYSLNQRFIEAKSETLESNYGYACLRLKEGSPWMLFSRMLSVILNESLKEKLGIADAIVFDDLYLTVYPKARKEGAMGVGPHRDTNCKGLVAAVILSGKLPAYVCKDKRRNGSMHLPVCAGEMLLMRADRCGSLPKPIHYVGEIKGEAVIQFGMRQYIDPNRK